MLLFLWLRVDRVNVLASFFLKKFCDVRFFNIFIEFIAISLLFYVLVFGL